MAIILNEQDNSHYLFQRERLKKKLVFGQITKLLNVCYCK